MLKRYQVIVLAMILGVLFSTSFVTSADAGSNDAVVTVLQGTAKVYSKGSTSGRGLKKGDELKQDQEIKVGMKSRLEIRFPDGTVMRLSEKAHLKMSALSFNKKTESKNVSVNLGTGKLWANVKKLATPESSVEVKLSNAVAGVRGTVYRINVNEDKSAVVKVYDGSVYVANPPRDTSQPTDKVTMPHQVAGPHEVAPPVHEVSMEEWHVIVKAMQQISISPQGQASKPQDFDAKSDADADDWVKWNQERDKEAVF